MEHHTNLMVDVRPSPSVGDMSHLEELLRTQQGVYSTRISDRVGHLLLVEYDAERISSRSILERVRSEGFDARLIGM